MAHSTASQMRQEILATYGFNAGLGRGKASHGMAKAGRMKRGSVARNIEKSRPRNSNYFDEGEKESRFSGRPTRPKMRLNYGALQVLLARRKRRECLQLDLALLHLPRPIPDFSIIFWAPAPSRVQLAQLSNVSACMHSCSDTQIYIFGSCCGAAYTPSVLSRCSPLLYTDVNS